MKYHIEFDIELRENPYKGLYIALEGVDGSGKTTQAKLLSDHFKKLGREVVLTREPRKTGLIGDLVQKILTGEKKIPSVALQYLFSADRSAHRAPTRRQVRTARAVGPGGHGHRLPRASSAYRR